MKNDFTKFKLSNLGKPKTIHKPLGLSLSSTRSVESPETVLDWFPSLQPTPIVIGILLRISVGIKVALAVCKLNIQCIPAERPFCKSLAKSGITLLSMSPLSASNVRSANSSIKNIIRGSLKPLEL